MKVIITIEGGNVQSVFTEFDTDVVVIDFDIDGIDPSKLKKIPDVYYGDKPCFVSSYQQITDPERIGEIMKAIGREYKKPERYVLFGTDVVNILEEEGFDELVNSIEDPSVIPVTSWDLSELTSDVEDMMATVEEYGKYAFITKEEYEKLSEL